MPGDNLKGIEPVIWACAYLRAMPTNLEGFTREECDRAITAAEREADLHIERRRDRETVRQRPIVERNLRPHERSSEAGSTEADDPRALLERIGYLRPRPADPEDQGDDDLNY